MKDNKHDVIQNSEIASSEICQENNPLISICLTCFNAEDTIERAVNSALAQTWPNKEIIIVDDCSTDKSFSILEKLSEKFNAIKILSHRKNKGTAVSRNTLIDAAKGGFITFFDDDDESMPDRISAQYKCISEYEKTTGNKLVACYASGERVYPNGYSLELEAIGCRGKVPVGELVANYILFNERQSDVFYGTGTPTCSLMAKAEVFHELKGFDQKFRRVEDMDFAVRLAIRGGAFIGCSEKLFIQYATLGSDKSALCNFEAETQLLDKHRKYLEKLNRYRYAKNWFYVRYCHFSGKRISMIRALIFAWFQNPILISKHFIASAPKRMLHEIKMSLRKS